MAEINGFNVTWDYDADAAEMTVHLHFESFSTFFLIDQIEGESWEDFCKDCVQQVKVYTREAKKGMKHLCG